MSVVLTLMRHGDAEPWTGSDRTRALTPLGRAQVAAVTSNLIEAGWRPGSVVHSPLVRAVQTADIVLDHLPRETPRVELEEVVSAGSGLLQMLAELGLPDPVVIGHEPTMGELVALLLEARGRVPFGKAGVACVRLNTLPPLSPGELLFFAPAALSLRPRG
jgi:phosphohistidine phosphatase